MKKLLALLLATLMALSLAACGGGEEPAPEGGEPTATQQQPTDPPSGDEGGVQDEAVGFAATRTGRFYSRFAGGQMSMTYEMEMEGEMATVTVSTSGDKTYTETTFGGQKSAVLFDGDTMYTIDHSSKMVVQMKAVTDPTTVASSIISEDEIDLETMQNGTRKVDGRTYDTEVLTVDGTSVTYCFDGDTLAYMIATDGGEEYIIKVTSVSSEVDESLFTLPSDYQLIQV